MPELPEVELLHVWKDGSSKKTSGNLESANVLVTQAVNSIARATRTAGFNAYATANHRSGTGREAAQKETSEIYKSNFGN